MHLEDDFYTKLQNLCDLDQVIIGQLTLSDINAEEIAQLVDNREQLLLGLLSMIETVPSLANSERWQAAVQQTQQVVKLMQEQTTLLGQSLHKYRHGNKSVQQYKKFL
ncbi:flagellar rod protein FlaI [Vibrio ponticus]|nr:flagellar rod protein FlaI [Vibrio ponticus]